MITINHQLCIGCGLCHVECSPKHIEMKDDKAVTNLHHCMSCGHCVAVCPQNAISVDDYDMSEVRDFDAANMQVEPERLFGFMQFQRSVRHFQAKPVEKEKIDLILESGRYTPTGSNAQQVRYIVFQDQLPKIRKLTAEASHKMAAALPPEMRFYRDIYLRIYEANKSDKDLLFHQAPLVISVIEKKVANNINASMAAARMQLMANSLGLGVCFIGLFGRVVINEPEIQETLGLASDEQIATSLAIGYPSVNYLRTVPRKKSSVKWM